MNSQRRVILISGGSSGLGAEMVSASLAQGDAVATFSRSSSPFIAEQQANDPEQKNFLWKALDGTDKRNVRAFVRQVAKHFGSIDALINNAAIVSHGVLPLMPDADVERMLDINLASVICLTQACTKVMLTQMRGAIVNISSINGVQGHAGVAVYSACKAGLDGLTRSLCRELGPYGIRVNSVAPGYFESPMVGALLSDVKLQRIARRTPLGRLAKPKDISGVVRFLLSPDAEFISGQIISVDGGISS